jgi:hypothetical protein
MAIDFGRIARGFTTGYLDAKIKNTEANDALKARVMENSATIYQTQILPDTIEAEKNRKEVYDQIASATNQNFAELADIGGYTTMKDGYQTALDLYKKTDKKKLEAAMFNTDYNQRYAKRGKTFNEKYEPIFNQIGIKQSGMLGPYTTELMLKEDQQEVTPSVKAGSPEFSSSAISDFIIQSQISYDIPESEFQKVASTMREFGQFFTQDPSTGELKVNLNETNRNEYGALRNLTQEIAQNYLDQDGNVNVSAAMTAASNMLTNQTKTTIYGRQLADRYEQGIASADGNSFSEKFNAKYQTDVEKKQYLANGLFNLDGGKDAQRFFAQSFPETVKFSDNTLVRDYLLRLTGLKR